MTEAYHPRMFICLLLFRLILIFILMVYTFLKRKVTKLHTLLTLR